MPLTSTMVGVTGDPAHDLIEDRWTMNYPASVYDENPAYYDNADGRAVPVHPAYLSHLEWDAISAVHDRLPQLTTDERRRGVHSWNHTELEASFRAGDELTCVASVVGVEQRRSGGRLTIKTVTTRDGAPIATSFTRSVYRGVPVDGDDVPPEIPPFGSSARTGEVTRVEDIAMTALAPYHFSECARDYGAIHTDRNEAAKAGLPGLILHGTGTFAYVLSSITNHEASGDPTRVTGFEGRLGAMVLCPSTVRLQVFGDASDGLLQFQLLNEDGDQAISDGRVRLAVR